MRGTHGRLKLLDGHLRRDLDPDMEVDVEILDVTEEEARKLLLTIDPLAALLGWAWNALPIVSWDDSEHEGGTPEVIRVSEFEKSVARKRIGAHCQLP
jgi:hypothetical protein